MGTPRHIPVLLTETLSLLDPRPGDTLLDCTAGLGGHAAAFVPRLGPSGTIILNDLDPANLTRAADAIRALPNPPRLVELHGNYADAPRRITESALAADIVLADLGFASNQVEDPLRGLSFMREGPLDMRLNPHATLTAADLVNTLSEAELGEILRDFGEERHWRRIAQKLVAARTDSPISTTGRLASIVRSAAVRQDPSGIDPSTRTFQALRIAVNDELGSLRALLESISRAAVILKHHPAAPARTWLNPGARLGIISFHSLEDRLVKNAFTDIADRGLAGQLTRRPVEASADEQARNPRSRSAKLRVIRLIVDKPERAEQVV